MTDIPEQKDALRVTAKRARSEANALVTDSADSVLANVRDNLSRLGLDNTGFCVATYLPIGSEIDTMPLIHWLRDAGHTHCLPVVTDNGAPLIFRVWGLGDELIDGGFGTKCPSPRAKTVTPDVVFVPLLAFDKAGYRLGYGGGFYDRTLAAIRRARAVTAIGLAFSAQEVDTVPRDEYDQPLDAIVTERTVIRLS